MSKVSRMGNPKLAFSKAEAEAFPALPERREGCTYVCFMDGTLNGDYVLI